MTALNEHRTRARKQALKSSSKRQSQRERERERTTNMRQYTCSIQKSSSEKSSDQINHVHMNPNYVNILVMHRTYTNEIE